ncbi:MAG: DEAD/DEAH box helicase [Rhodoferax sp.]|nr:DEAD/DEAH box helicase [Rhodoferax sp.]
MNINAYIDYDNLSALKKIILQIISIAYSPVNMTQLINCLAALNIKSEDGDDFHNGSQNGKFSRIRPTIDGLLELNIFEGKSRSSLVLSSKIAKLLTKICVQENKFNEYLEVVQKYIIKMPDDSEVDSQAYKTEQLTAFIRMLFYQGRKDDIALFHRKHKNSFQSCLPLDEIIKQLAAPDSAAFDPEWFELLPTETRTYIFENPIRDDILMWSNSARHMGYIEDMVTSDSQRYIFSLKETVLEKWILCGKKDLVREWLKNQPNKEDGKLLCLKGFLEFLEGKNQTAIKYFESALTGLPKNRIDYFNNFSGVFYLLALMKENTPQSLDEARKHLSILRYQAGYWFKEAYEGLHYTLAFLDGKSKEANSIFNEMYLGGVGSYDAKHCVKYFFKLFCFGWIDPGQAKKHLKDIKYYSNKAKENGYLWFYDELEALYKYLSADKEEAAEGIAASSLIGVVQRNNVWEKTINALIALKQPPKKSTTPATKTGVTDLRMAWFINCNSAGSCSASPREQKLDAKGKWSKGRPIALKNLCLEPGTYPYTSQQDREVLSHLRAHQYKDGWYTKTEYIFNEKYLIALVGHPLIFLEDGETKLELTKGKPELLVTRQKGGGYRLYLSPSPGKGMAKEQYIAIQETKTRVKLVKVDEDYHRIAEVLGDGITVPASAREKIKQVIDKFAQDILINSDLEGESAQLKEVKADSSIHVLLLPAGRGLKISLFVRPVKTGAYYVPGSGGRMVISEVNGVKLQTVRDIKQEEKNAAALVNKCPTLERNSGTDAGTDNEWVLDDPACCLEVLFELRELKGSIVLEWPEGEKFKLLGQSSFKHFHLNIQRQQEWFLATGSIQLDDKLVLDMQKLLELTAATKSRFLEIADGQFIALTHEFHKRLQELNRYSQRHGKGVRFHPLAAFALESLTNEAGHLKTDQDWKDYIQKLQVTDEGQFSVPSTLQTELRAYQREGVNWLCRLAHWEVGACLADDMGLGKTIQAMAVLLKFAPKGPSLVIAPTSVCMNWLEEVKRFAPTLNVIQFGGGNRAKTLQALSKFDVLVCSYGLLQQETEMLSAISWQMVVLDEAQAIKNYFTKRSRAAMNLEAKFKLIMTGTPIENNLGELWNLFQFINPGLLGSLEEFNLKYVLPIERDHDSQARQHLKKLIQPIILRRTKNRVLDELPARTEIRLQVELSQEEAAFYEALRQQAVATLAEEEGKPGSSHLKILAEIMKLRRACCNTQLVHEDISLPSSKLAVFGEVLGELLENNHKALVFSQFVGHLHLIRNYLDEQKISYQYLDGSTPVKDRKSAVDAFQSGEGDVFLISLKAGGLGLNLTAADYVIHMDPWWNPAVEDQASDRAHRIGQQRPVTIYRLVAKDTIEEKIVELHNTKRDLADSLLDGSDVSGKLSTQELLSLLNR